MKTVLNIKTDKEVKERAKALAEHLGVPLSTVVNAYLKEFIVSGSFHITREPELKQSVIKALSREMAETKKGKGLSPAFKSADEATAWLNS